MAHNLNFNKNTGTYSFASSVQPAWHGLGQILSQRMTAEEAIKNANLDYIVDKTNIFYVSNGNPRIMDGYFATYRTDNGDNLGLVKSRYEIVQNSDAFGFFDAIVDSGEAVYETAGALGRGEKIFLLAKLPDDFQVGGEKIDRYILLTNSHDGSSSIVAGMTNIRVVCNNTLQAALKGLDNKVSIDHVSGAKEALKEAHKVMGIASKYTSEISDIFNQMADVKLTEGKYREYFTKVFTPDVKQVVSQEEQKEASTKLKNMVEATTQFAMTHPSQITDAANGTLWGAYNAVSGYYNYIKNFKNSEDKFSSQFFGAANKKMQKSFNTALELI